MFKGLRNKIESEQKGRINSTPTKPEISNNSDGTACTTKPDVSSSTTTNTSLSSSSTKHSENHGLLITNAHTRSTAQNSDTTEVAAKEISNDTGDNSPCEVLDLKAQLDILAKEKEEVISSNTHLSQSIADLQAQLETERKHKSSVEANLRKTEAALDEKTRIIETIDKNKNDVHTKGVPMKPFDPSYDDPSLQDDTDDVDLLKSKLIGLRHQLNEKSRQLKIKHQNLIDVKKTLQREISEHSQTQEKLRQVQNQLEETLHSQKNNELAAHSNGSTNSATSMCNNQPNVKSSHDPERDSYTAMNHSDTDPDRHKDIDNMQSDTVSYVSRSETSTDDDVGEYTKIVNHEYLKNVLFRYMTSTNTETTKHLVKALSVLLDFTPEQKQAVKQAMTVRSSWLRLK